MFIDSLPSLITAVNTYFDALYECDLPKFDQVFHQSCSLFDASNGIFTAMPIPNYREIIAHRKSPKSAGQQREDRLISIDFLSPDSAVVKVRLRIHDKVFVDHLNFMRVDQRFMIVAKLWHDATSEV
ncbi:nuclear transport factor 2 family protein, partial [Ralstonia chuxiongensis]|uniref:nuclear transport factor 2 family protein n=1 Tax=Ralstonia chuxiongensis TaxID=2957504 RepID=UPI00292F7B5A